MTILLAFVFVMTKWSKEVGDWLIYYTEEIVHCLYHCLNFFWIGVRLRSMYLIRHASCLFIPIDSSKLLFTFK